MPSNMMDQQGLYSSSYFSDEVHFPSERQVGFWKKENTIGRYAENKMVASSPFKKFIPLESQDEEFLGHTKPHLNCDQKVNIGPGIPTAGMGGPASYSSVLLGPADCGQRERTNLSAQTRSYLVEGEKINMMGAQYENSLFSSSFSDLFTRKLELSANNALLGHSVDTVANYEEVEPFDSLEEIEAQTIGNLLPNDDELLSGVADGLDYIIQPGGADDIEDLDLFSSLGGMDLEDESSSVGQRGSEDPKRTFSSQIRGSSGSIAAPHPFGEQPSRTLFVRNVNSNVEDSELWALFEQYGDIWTLYTVCKHRGFVMVSYYDLRAAQNAMRTLQNAPLRRRKLDIHFSIPKDIPSEKDINQGTLLVFNLDSSVPNDEIHQIFGVYGEIKEIWESHGHKFIEFYDIRAAESALRALNRSDIAGKQIKLEHSRLGVARRLMQHLPSYLEQNDSSVYLQPNSSPNTYRTGFSHEALTSGSMDYETILGVRSAVRAPITPFLGNTYHGISSSVTERADLVGDQSGLIEPDQSQGHWKFNFQGTPVFHPHSLPEYHDGLTNGVPFKSPGPMATNISSTPSGRFENGQMHGVNSNGHSVELNEGVFGSSEIGSFPFSGHQYTWNNICPPRPPGMMWPNSPSFVNGVCTAPASQVHGVPNAPSHILSTVAALANHHAGSAPAVNPPLWERRHSYAGQSPEASGFLSGSLGRVNSPHPLDFLPPNIFPSVSRNSTDLQIPPKNVRLHSRHQRCLVFPERGQMIPLLGTFNSPNERGRSRRNENSSNLADKRQFELDLDRIVCGEDSRTTLMIKNIPNKYTSKMLLATIDEHHRGTFDFLYLPIDFKNKCNVGYAFINMTDPSQIIPFYQALNGKKWEKFNSEKVASLAYARIQGKAALISHFQHSSLMNEDKRCRPILFHTDGPNAGDQVPFPMGVSIRSRPSKSRTNTIEENHYHENTSNLENGEESCSRGSSSGSAKELD